MIPDIRFEAGFLRSALLLGKVREPEVPSWADTLLEAGAEPVALLAEVAVARAELTVLREALLPLATSTHHESLGNALLAFLATDHDAIAQTVPDRIRVLAQLRRENIVGPSLAQTIKTFEDRSMLASAGIGVDPTIAADFDQWFASVSGPRYYRVSVGGADERAALLGALARKVVRDRRVVLSPLRVKRAWLCASVAGINPTVLLNAPLWELVVAEFSPLPLGSRIPYCMLPASATLILDEATAEPMGTREAGDWLAEKPG